MCSYVIVSQRTLHQVIKDVRQLFHLRVDGLLYCYMNYCHLPCTRLKLKLALITYRPLRYSFGHACGCGIKGGALQIFSSVQRVGWPQPLLIDHTLKIL